MVTKVDRRGSAARRLLTGDIITGLAGRHIENWDDLLTALYLTPAGKVANVTYLRGTVTRHTEVILACAL